MPKRTPTTRKMAKKPANKPSDKVADQPISNSTSAPLTTTFHALAAELATSVARDTALLHRLTGHQLPHGDSLTEAAHKLAQSASALRLALLKRMGVIDHDAYFGGSVGPLRIATEEAQKNLQFRRLRASTTIAPDEVRYLPLLRENVFEGSSGVRPERFPWRRTREGTIEALRPDSAQALAISLWGTAARGASQVVRQIVEFYMQGAIDGFEHCSPLNISSRYEVPADSLSATAPKHTRLPVIVEYGNPNAGWDSRMKTLVVDTTTIEDDHHRCPGFSTGRCDGTYENSGRGCPLDVSRTPDAPDAFPWARVHALCGPGAFKVAVDCPFSGTNFHRMRVVAGTEALRTDQRPVAVALCYVGTWGPHVAQEIEALRDLLLESVRKRVIAIDLENVVDELIGSDDNDAASLGIFLWRRLRVLGLPMLGRLVTAKLEPPDATLPTTELQRNMRAMSRQLPNTPVRHRGRPISRKADRWAGPYEALVTSFVHPMTGAEAFITCDGDTLRVRVPLRHDGESVIRSAFAALSDDRTKEKSPSSHGQFAVGAITRRGGLDEQIVIEAVKAAGFLVAER